MKGLSYHQLLYLSEQIKKNILHSKIISIKEKAAKEWILSFKKEKKIFYLLLCLQPPFTRFHLISTIPSMRKTAFTQKIEQKISTRSVTTFELMNKDRILRVGFDNGISLVAELFSRGSNLYLIDRTNQILVSAIIVDKKEYTLPPRISHEEETIDPDFLNKIEDFYSQKEKMHSFQKEKENLLNKLNRLKNKTTKKLKSLKTTISSCSKWKEVLSDAQLLQSNYHMLKKGLKAIEIMDWKESKKKILYLDERLPPKEQLQSFFHKAHKMQKQMLQAQKEIEQLEPLLDQYNNLIAKATTINTSQQIQNFLNEQEFFKEPKKEKPKIGIEFFSASGLKMLVGKNATENLKLTFQMAKGSDYWLHISDYSGPHVILQVPKGKKPDQEAVIDAAHLAIYYSKVKEGDVILTQRKYLSKLRDEKVGISKHKTLHIRLDLKRIETIKQRKKIKDLH